jgi:4-aminobutyrate aminotransferase/(S)-3-amino-2-methylpropionate transaminase
VGNVRGTGTFLAFDILNEKHNDFLSSLRNAGIEAQFCGVNSVRVRPHLIFAPRHAAQLVDAVDSTLKKL